MPSKDELNQLYVNRAYVPGLITLPNTFYFSSSQGSSTTNFWTQNFNDGTQADYRTRTGSPTPGTYLVAIKSF